MASSKESAAGSRSFPSVAYGTLKQTVNEFTEAKAPRLAAALAFYTVLSLSPLVVLAVAIAGLAFGEEAARGQISSELTAVVGSQGAGAIETVVNNAKRPDESIPSAIVGLVVLLFGASGVFGELQSTLNAIWRVEPKPGQGIKQMIRDRLASFAMVMGVAFLLLVSLVVSAGLSALGKFLSNSLPGGEALWSVLNLAISLAVVTVLFAATFKTVPDARVAWHDVWIGAGVTAALFTLGKFAIGLYLGRSSVSSTYGAAGSLVALVVWVYYSAIILLFGAAFTRVFALRFGSRIEPDENAVLTDESAEPGVQRPDVQRSSGQRPGGQRPSAAH